MSLFAATALSLDVPLISGVVGLIALSVSTIWSFFQMKQKLEAQIEGMRLLILKNKEDNAQLRKDVIYAVRALQSELEVLKDFLARADQNPRFIHRANSSGMTPKDFVDYTLRGED